MTHNDVSGDARSKSEETRDRILSLLRPFALQVRINT